MAGIFGNQLKSAPGSSPFQPGRGRLPPYLAGRGQEQALIREFLASLAEQVPPASDIILYGPRGNGKTALIEWTRREAEALKIHVACLLGGDIASVEQLAAALLVERRWLNALRGFSLGPIGVRLRSLPPGPVSWALARRVRKDPFLILVDEAHMLGTEPGRSLLATVQAFQSKELPVLLVLAGTPDLPRRLRDMGASFWVRNKRLRIGRLKTDAAADAISVPLQEAGRSIEHEALQQVAAESHGYPFFLQLWGDLLWNGCADPSMPVAASDVDRARPLFQQGREDLYDELLDELEDSHLVSVAAAVAAEFAASQHVLRERVRRAIQSSLRQNGRKWDREAALVAERVLRHLGFVWAVVHQGTPAYEPGIPSLMHYVANYERQRLALDGIA